MVTEVNILVNSRQCRKTPFWGEGFEPTLSGLDVFFIDQLPQEESLMKIGTKSRPGSAICGIVARGMA
jgi:hypothetical protein